MTQEFKPKTQSLPTVADGSDVTTNMAKELMTSRIKTFNPFRRMRGIEWNINIAYMLGHQYIGLSGGHLARATNMSPYATTANKLGPAVRNDIAIATKVPPQYEVVPDSTDSDDKATAIAGLQMIGYLNRLNNFDRQRGKLMLWYDIAGVSWRKQYWDPYYKLIGHNPEPEEEGHNPNLEAGEPIYQGEALSEHTPNNELIYDWRQNLDRLPWIIHAIPMTLSEARILWGDKVNSIPESAFITPNEGMNEFEIKVFNEFAQFTTAAPTGPVKLDTEKLGNEDKLLIAYEMWQIRDRNYPLGMYSTMAGLDPGLVMDVKPYPIENYPHGEVPFVGYDLMSIDKAVTGSASKISQARPLQNELNDVRTLIKENIATLGGGLWKVPRDGKINITRMDDGVGLMVEYDGPYAPSREGGVPISGDVFAYVEKIESDINDIFSFPKVSQGKRPRGGPKSGVGIHLLQEASLTQHSPAILEMEGKDERAMAQLLSIAFANYNKRTLNIVGKDNEWTLFEYDPTSFQSKLNVKIRVGSSLPVSKAIERELALGLGQAGWLGPPQSPQVRKRVLQTIDIGGLDGILKDNAKHVNFAKKEFSVPIATYKNYLAQRRYELGPNNQISGEELKEILYVPAVNPFDNHDVHIIEHQDDLIGKYYEWIGTNDPGMVILANAMRDHWGQHSVILAAQQYQQAVLTGQIKPNESDSQKSSERRK